MKDQISFVETPHVSSSTLVVPPRSFTPPSPVKTILASASISSLHGDCSPAGPAASPTLTTLTLAADSLASHCDSAAVPASISASQYNPDTMWQAGIDASCAALDGSSPVPSSASESARSPEKSTPFVTKPLTTVMSGVWNQDLKFNPGPVDRPHRLKTYNPRRGLRTLQPCTTTAITTTSTRPALPSTQWDPDTSRITDEESEIEEKVARTLRTCPHCKTRVSQDNYQRHLATHGNKANKCDLCGQVLKQGDNLLRHKEERCKRLDFILPSVFSFLVLNIFWF